MYLLCVFACGVGVNVQSVGAPSRGRCVDAPQPTSRPRVAVLPSCQVLRRDMRRFDTAEVEDIVYEGEEKQSPDVFKYLLDRLWTDDGAYKGKRVLAERRNKIENQPVSLGLLERWSDGSLQVRFFYPIFCCSFTVVFRPLWAPSLPALFLPPHTPPLFSTASRAVPRDGVHGAGRARRHPAHPLRARGGRHRRRVQRRGPGTTHWSTPPT